MRWVAAELTADNLLMLYVPEGCAHGFQTLEDNTEVFYHMSAFYAPACVRGVRWNDPTFGIHWPLPVTVIAGRDQQYPDYTPMHQV
jgi:dTDP-4-dehydrorhamnose 3,5-epimerase